MQKYRISSILRQPCSLLPSLLLSWLLLGFRSLTRSFSYCILMSSDHNIPAKLVIAVCCHFNEARLSYLDRISNQFASLGSEVLVVIVTNTSNAEEIKKLESVIAGKGFNYQFFVPDTLGHPLLLTWAHFPVFKGLLKDESFTHFMSAPVLYLCFT